MHVCVRDGGRENDKTRERERTEQSVCMRYLYQHLEPRNGYQSQYQSQQPTVQIINAYMHLLQLE